MEFSNLLVRWYLENKRDLPWRNTTNPYHIWLSEIILQQTRVAQGLPYYIAFIERFPSVQDLAQASENEVLKLWQGLGYYTRARNLHQTAQFISNQQKGIFPNNYSELLQLKGIGTYTAAAIASFAYNEDVPVVDGNVFRVLSRYFGLEQDISDAKTKKIFFDLASEVLPKRKANVFNQAIMEFGALYCVPKNPDCTNCIFNDKCWALAHKKVNDLPVKSKKIKIKNRFFDSIIFIDTQNKTLLNQRTHKDIWYNLYDFPSFENEQLVSEHTLHQQLIHQTFVENQITHVELLNPKIISHKLSHQRLHFRFWKVTVEGELVNGIDWKSAFQKPLPIIVHDFILRQKFFH